MNTNNKNNLSVTLSCLCLGLTLPPILDHTFRLYVINELPHSQSGIKAHVYAWHQTYRLIRDSLNFMAYEQFTAKSSCLLKSRVQLYSSRYQKKLSKNLNVLAF